MALCNFNPTQGIFPLQGLSKSQELGCFSLLEFSSCGSYSTLKAKRFGFCIRAKFLEKQAGKLDRGYGATVERKEVKKVGENEHHLWKKNDSAGSGQKALNLVRMLSGLPNEKEAGYGALNKWVAWEVEFPIIAAAKALQILRKRSQWHHVIQVAKWMLSKGQGATMGTYDTLLLAFDMDERADEAESLWNMILHTHTRSIPRRLFARMIALYSHHDLHDKVIEVFADMEELKVRPDEDTARRVARAFRELGQEENRKLILRRYLSEFKYIYFNGERVRVKRYSSEEG
ncbi:PREDICTED: pentatricopeptide repeat-containing protein At4g18975, chloroplastic [Camelina sativa]|uniref:Pentatricopeptide repeat-containing protein At4g18975, chloroplastic n=1 Tax=Camelina sativa TaxID=90675 RepID=A0ABM0U1I8_CAMSA|nr:PREDICTED: pentatricopeptide repeat-containing protein At4g18975, chloroplastic [Camelina sativa]